MKIKRYIKKIINLILIWTILFSSFSMPIDIVLAENDTANFNHEHVWTKTWDENNHWEYCTVCNQIKEDKEQHDFEDHWIMGQASCSSQNYSVRTCKDEGCGYSVIYHEQHEYDLLPSGQPNWQQSTPGEAVHYYKCKKCNEWMATEKCHDAEGSLSCSNPGICQVCGMEVSENNHYLKNYTQNDGSVIARCMFCEQDFVSISKPTIHYSTGYTSASVTFKVTPLRDDVTLNRYNGEYPTNPGTGYVSTINYGSTGGYNIIPDYSLYDDDGSITFTYVYTFDNSKQRKATIKVGDNTGFILVDENPVYIEEGMAPHTIWQDHIAPTIDSIETEDQTSAQNGWATIKKVNITGTENLSNVVYITIMDKETHEIYIENAAANVEEGTDGIKRYSYYCLPPVEGDENGKTYTVIVKDSIGLEGEEDNTATGEFTVTKTDVSGPKTDSNLEYTDWTNTPKQVSIKFTDEGSGNVQISLDSDEESNYSAPIIPDSQNYYVWNYTFSADTNEIEEHYIYAKDALGNVSRYVLKIGKIDCTLPTIENVQSSAIPEELNKATVNVTATDTGSGITQYYLKNDNGVVAQNQTGIFNNISQPGEYKVYVEDLAGNKSAEVAVTVNIYCKLTINPNEGKWNNLTEPSEFIMLNGETKVIEAPTREGYIFKNWEIAEQSTQSTINEETFTMGILNTTIVANWEKYEGIKYIIGENAVGIIDEDTGNITIKSTSGVGTIFKNMFDDFKNIIDISKVKEITFENEINAPDNSQEMFHNFISLTEIHDISNMKTGNVTNMYSMFLNCLNLKQLDVSHFNTSNVTDMGAMFYNCKQLKNIDVSSFNTSEVVNMDEMFRGCKLLENIDLNHFDTSNVETMHYMFADCNALTNIQINNFDTANALDMGAMFYNCSNLTTLNITNFNTSNVEAMDGMFYGCSKLSSLDLSSFNMGNVMEVGGMLEGCNALESIKTPNNLAEDISIALPGIYKNSNNPSDNNSYEIIKKENFNTSVQLSKVKDVIESIAYEIDENGYITQVKNNTNVEALINNINLNINGTIKVLDSDNQEVSNTAIVGTGNKIQITTENGTTFEYEIAVNGDLSGDGKITVTDLSIMQKKIVGKTELYGSKEKASDLDDNDVISVTDLSILIQFLVGKTTL